MPFAKEPTGPARAGLEKLSKARLIQLLLEEREIARPRLEEKDNRIAELSEQLARVQREHDEESNRQKIRDNHTNWYKRRNFPSKPPATKAPASAGLELGIAGYFNQTQGRGGHCKVEPLRRNDLDYFVAYREDYTEQRREWEGGTLQSAHRHPAFEIVFVYSQRDSTLDLHCPGGRKIAEAMQALFARHILDTEDLKPDEDDHRIYALEPLLDRTFSFRTDTSQHVQSIRLKHFRFADESSEDRIILVTNTRKDRCALHDVLDRYRDAMRLGDLGLDQVKLSARAADPATGEWKSRDFSIILPNACALKYEGRDLAIRQVLEASGIEPREPDGSA